tara:strand:+ start:239 stop:946 length:708 start_codon:yes stop_codon:yes gene_type:complete
MVKKKAKKKRRFYEIFKLKKKDEEKTVKVEGFETIEEKPEKEQIIKENKILRNIFISIGIIVVLILLGYLAVNNIRNFEHQGVNFETVKFCDVKPCLILYQTSLPVISNGNKAEYNFYLRNDPRNLNVSFKGEVNLIPNMVVNATSDFNCNGDGIISMANLVKLYEIIGTSVIKNEALECDPSGNHMFLQIQEANETSIEQFGMACYTLNVNNCEILEVTEKFMIETFVEVERKL